MPLKNLLRASYLVTLKCHKHGHVHIGNARVQRGQGVYRKMQFGPITLEKVAPP